MDIVLSLSGFLNLLALLTALTVHKLGDIDHMFSCMLLVFDDTTFQPVNLWAYVSIVAFLLDNFSKMHKLEISIA